MTLNALCRIKLKEVESLKQLWQAQLTESDQNIPNIFREPAILSGYRVPGKTWHYYAVSIFQFHNETLNIWTHLIATLVFIQKTLQILDLYIIPNDCEALPLAVFCICAAVNSFLSAFAHTFHSKSQFCHYVCFLLDYAGVGLFAFGQCILLMHTSCPEVVYKYLRRVSLPMNVFLSLIVMFGGSASKLLFSRPYPFKRRLIQIGSCSIHASFSFIPLVARLIYCYTEKGCSNTHHFYWLISMVVCLFFFSSHLPEKLTPGKFDFVGQGHQLFHVFQTLTVLLLLNAAEEDISDNFRYGWFCNYLSVKDLRSAVSFYVLGCIFAILFAIKFLRRKKV